MENLTLDTCDKCGKETANLFYVGRDGYDFLCETCQFPGCRCEPDMCGLHPGATTCGLRSLTCPPSK